MTCEVTEGIVEAGISGVHSTVPVLAGIAGGSEAPLTTAGITEQSATAPRLPLAAHIGSGAILFTWLPATGQVDHYEINFSTSESGVYVPYGRSIFRKPLAIINNFPFGRTVYFRIRTVTADGNASDWVQVKLGILQKQSTVMRVRGPYGSVVAAGARVAVLDDVDRLAGFYAEDELQL